MRAPQDAIAIEHEIPFHDVDSLQIVWHGNYYKYFGMASTALFRAHALHPAVLAAEGLSLVVVDSSCRHSFPLRYMDTIRVSAWFLDVELRVTVAYEIFNVTHGRRAARGRTVLVTLDSSGSLLYATPPPLAERLRARASLQ